MTDLSLRLPNRRLRAVLNLGTKNAATLTLPARFAKPVLFADWDDTEEFSALYVEFTDGQLTSDGALTAVIAGQLLNQTGLFAAKGDARLTLGSLDNRQGNLAANTLNLQVNGPLNNSHGTLRGEARLDLTAGQVDNSTGGRISAGTTLNANVASLDQHDDGRLFGQGA